MFVGICCFFFNDTATTEIYTFSLHDALPISLRRHVRPGGGARPRNGDRQAEFRGAALHPLRLHGDGRRGLEPRQPRSEEHTSELQSRQYLVCRLLLEKKK